MKKSIMFAIVLTACLCLVGCALFNGGSDEELSWCGEPAKAETTK